MSFINFKLFASFVIIYTSRKFRNNKIYLSYYYSNTLIVFLQSNGLDFVSYNNLLRLSGTIFKTTIQN